MREDGALDSAVEQWRCEGGPSAGAFKDDLQDRCLTWRKGKSQKRGHALMDQGSKGMTFLSILICNKLPQM